MTTTPDISLPLSDGAPPPPEGSRFGKAHHILLIFCAAALVTWLLSGIYVVNADEVAIVERLGTYVSTPDGRPIPVEHGPHLSLPWPIDIVHKIPVQRATSILIKTFNESPDSYADFKNTYQKMGAPPDLISALFDPYLITGDKNVVHMEIAVTYRIDDPDAWLNTVAFDPNQNPALEGNREDLLRRLIEHAMISQIATVEIDHILSEGSDRLPPLLTNAISQNMDLPDPSDRTGKHKLSLGVRIEKVDVTAAHPPQMVQPAFDRVFQARANRESTRLQAEASANTAVNNAGADKANLIQDAQAYKSATVDAARGEAARFSQIYSQYQIAPDIAAYNAYYDAVHAVETSATRTIYAEPGQHIWITIDPPKFDATQPPPR